MKPAKPGKTPKPGEKMRLQRFMAQAGVASRRKAEEMIVAGRVKVNGKVVTELGTQVDPRRDEVQVAGQKLAAQRHIYLLLNKPRGYVTTLSDPEKRPTVMELLGEVEERVYPVGRLDFNTEGVLILTNDGELAHGLMHPKGEVEKTYQVKLRGLATPEVVESFARGVTLDDGTRTAPAKVQLIGATEGGNNSWLEVTIHEGKNRQIHRMAEALGHQVAKLQRVRYAGLDAGTLRPGKYRQLVDREIETLRRAAGLTKEKSRGKVPGKWSSGPSPTSTSFSRSSPRSSRPSPKGSFRSKDRRRS
jgi:23S rRNA pseudouridine2605 synthase